MAPSPRPVAPLDDLARVRSWRAAERRAAEAAWFRERFGPAGALAHRVHRALRPLRCAARAIPGLRLSSGEIARRERIGRVAQAWHLWWLWTRHGVPPREFYLYRLQDPARRRRAGRYVLQAWNLDVIRRLDALTDMFWPKLEFRRACRARGLPSIPVLAVFRAGRVEPEDGPGPEAAAWDGDLYVKQNVSAAGHDVEFWSRRPDGRYVESGQALTRAELIEHYRRRSEERVYLVQARIHNHPDLAPISNGHVCSLRMTTFTAAGGGVEIALPTLKLCVGAAVVDHIRHGNLAAPVDPATGRLGPGRTYSARLVVSESETHPDTGERIVGRAVPLWRETVELCRRAHASFDGLTACGWDVAVTADGPVLIEGNHPFGVELVQVAWDAPLGDTGYPAGLWARARQVLAAGAQGAAPRRRRARRAIGSG